jgi:phosphate:Na+ symporter
MNIIGQILQIVGSLGLFLYGMRVMSEGLQKSAGDRMKSILKMMTGNRFAAVFTGFAITAIIQSSSATTVMIVSFVNASLMNLTQAVGVILGANIGTTVTGWLVAILGFKIKVSALAIPAIAIGFPFLFVRRLKRKEIGEILIGFGLLFLGLEFLKNSVPDIQQYPDLLAFLQHTGSGSFLSLMLYVTVGTLITIVVQSSSASMAITLTMAHAGWIGFPAAAAMVLGQNIGTTATAYLASLGANTTARRASRAHIIFNLAGSLWVLVIIHPFMQFIDFIVPGAAYGPDSVNHLPQHMAMFHTIFNVTNTIIFLPFLKQFVALVERIVKPRQGEILDDEYHYHFTYLASAFQDTPEIYLIKVQDEVVKMANVTSSMFKKFREVFNHPDTEMSDQVKQLKKLEELTDQMQEQLSQFLVSVAQENLTPHSAKQINSMIRIINELESIGDCCFNLILLSQRRYNNGYHFSEESHAQLEEYSEMVQQFIDFIRDHLDRRITDTDLQTAITYERRINEMRDKMRDKAQKDLSEGADIRTELLLIDKVRHLEHIGDYCINIAEALQLIDAT